MPRRKLSCQSLSAIAVFCSGKGSNLQAILNAQRRGNLPAHVALVISDRPNARALKRAERSGVEARFINPKQYPTRGAYERALIGLLNAKDIQLVCLAGFMRVLSPVFVKHFSNRILNIHPALLPAFPGAHAVRDALEWGAKVSGVTVHFVDKEVDHGPIIVQEALRILPQDNEQTLLKRIHKIEHRIYPQAIRMVIQGRVKMAGRIVRPRDRA